ncbi:hypothetical protein P2318_30105 [Myxococcaceae bacterium GXIMD 01537]
MRNSTVLLPIGLLLACGASSGVGHGRRDLRLDTYSTSCTRFPASCVKTAPPPPPPPPAASVSAGAATAAGALVFSDSAALDELELRLVECAAKADAEVNRRWFGNRGPSDKECGEEVSIDVDGCLEWVPRAVALGREKHEVAFACARKVLEEGNHSFSLEQRYRYYRESRFLEQVSNEEEARLMTRGCTQGLWRTIKPDLVVHAKGEKHGPCRIFDFKFPCLSGRKPAWTKYGSKSAFAGADQGTIYSEALGCVAVLVSPVGAIR